MTAGSVTPLVLFQFQGDDWEFRRILLTAIVAGALPDYFVSKGSNDGRRFSALWRPQHADAVSAWAEANGIRLTGPLLE
jgi:hypothetical protein